MTLKKGLLAIRGTGSDHVPVGGFGTLVVELTGTPSVPTLTLRERGLSAVEDLLGLVSPFNGDGESVTVPVKTQHRFTGC
jgi:hypothetical protein